MADETNSISTTPVNSRPDVGQSSSANHEQAEQNESVETVQRAMRKMAEKTPERVVEMTAMLGAMGPMGHPLHQKMNEEHISKMLDLAVQHDTNEFQLRKSQQEIDSEHERGSRIFHLVYFGIFVLLIIVILAMFRNQPNVLVPILTGVGGVVTGFIGGMGFARSGLSTKLKKSE